MRIATVIYSMGCGGAERVMAVLVNAWSDRSHQVTLLTLNEQPSFYPLNPAVEYRALGVARTSHGFLQRVRNNIHCISRLRHVIRDFRPDIIVSFLDATNVVTLLTSVGLNIPVIVSEHNDPSHRNCSSPWRMMRAMTYPLASAVTFLTEAALDSMRWLVGSRGLVVPNPVCVPAPSHEVFETKDGGHRIIAMGRLHPVKGFNYLLDAFARIAGDHPDWTLTILGEGPMRPALQRQIQALGLSARIELRGQVEDPFPWLRSADLFVMSSLFEAFPCALCEAMACGLPVISFDCPSGPRAIIRDGIDGVLVPPRDVHGLGRAMERLMSDADERRRLAARSPEVVQRFSLDSVLRQWDEVFRGVGVLRSAAVQPKTTAMPGLP